MMTSLSARHPIRRVKRGFSEVPYVGYDPGNIYTSTSTGGALPEPSLAAPYHVLLATVTAGYSAQITLSLWDDGPASLSWSGSAAASWLSFQTGSGTIADENTTVSPILNIDASELSAGTYFSTITIDGKVFGIYLTVSAPG